MPHAASQSRAASSRDQTQRDTASYSRCVPRAPAAAWMAALALLLAACGSTSESRESVSAPEPTAPGSTATTSPPVQLLPDPRLASAAGAGQAVVVTADAYEATTATLTAYERQGASWRRALGPWTAAIGRNGFAPPGEKVEGDGRTPSGAYSFGFFFGVAPNPGVRFEYRQVPDESIVWDEDPSSPTYNLWVDLDDYGGGTDPEGMYQPVEYEHGAVIAYNTARTPGLGSGIFLHATNGGPTAGCVSLPVDQLVAVLRWLDPARSPRIVMGVAA